MRFTLINLCCRLSDEALSVALLALSFPLLAALFQIGRAAAL